MNDTADFSALLNQPMPGEVAAQLAQRVKERRKEHRWTQAQLAKRAGMSLGSLRRFEQQHEISLQSLINIAFALGCEGDFSALFATPYYRTLEDVKAATRRARRQQLKKSAS